MRDYVLVTYQIVRLMVPRRSAIARGRACPLGRFRAGLVRRGGLATRQRARAWRHRLVGHRRQGRLVRISESLGFSGPEGGSVTVTSHRLVDDASSRSSVNGPPWIHFWRLRAVERLTPLWTGRAGPVARWR